MEKTFITLTTDWGLKDHYVALMKARLLSLCKRNIEIIDISHNISPHDITEAAFVLRNVIHAFPPGTIHIVDISSEASKQTPHVCLIKDQAYFIGTDNGLFSLVVNDFDELYEIDIMQDTNVYTFSAFEIFTKAASMIANGEHPGKLGHKKQQLINILKPMEPQIQANILSGYVEHIDNYGNIISNIHSDLFYNFISGCQAFTIRIATEEITYIYETYADVPPGELVACFNASGYLEIALNKGNAAKLLGVKKNDVIRIIKTSSY